ncbi:F-box protein CPR30-like [Momordica charantia]|uniref:F-box protein CPR30-like n=1 Tax=Momordica charantia TaxID=3673 RepID=A0A6J1DX53_MOMCH|nr:F-box protein CPR30-like [Momordica charantia]XP_022158899.1 F-box protein CPR30-like [Momordica charantia]XP_022158900.1 F-box protein CPR30-like [Momordica charantia]
MSGCLPQEVLFNIFLKLSPKTLLLCSCVSKSWQSVVTSPIFIAAHLSRTSTLDKKCLLLRRCYGTGSTKKERYSLHFDTQTLDLYLELKFPFINWNENFKLVGICNGLVCLSGLDILLWNPSIQRVVALPRTSDITTICGAPDNYALGFGFDSRANDYKVVRLLYFEDKTLFNYKRSPKVELYEVRTGSWRVIGNKAPRCEIVQSEWRQAFVNGAVHWVAYRENSTGYRCFILRFDTVEEGFSIIALPECLVNHSPSDLKVAMLGGALSIMVCGWHCFDTYVSSVWVLQKYNVPESWTRLIILDPSQELGMVLGLGENGEMLMASKRGEVVLYEPENKLMKGLGIYGAEDSFCLDTYVESLALLNEGKGILEEAEVYN